MYLDPITEEGFNSGSSLILTVDVICRVLLNSINSFNKIELGLILNLILLWVQGIYSIWDS